jgi:hypothetical protein
VNFFEISQSPYSVEVLGIFVCSDVGYVMDKVVCTIELKDRMFDRMFDRAFVKRSCQMVYGGPIAKDTWRNWKLWGGLDTSALYFNFDNFCWLMAIATIRRQHRICGQYPELKSSQIAIVRDSLDLQTMIGELIATTDRAAVMRGYQLPKALESHGIVVTWKNLSDRFKLSTNGWYGLWDVMAMVKG